MYARLISSLSFVIIVSMTLMCRFLHFPHNGVELSLLMDYGMGVLLSTSNPCLYLLTPMHRTITY